ncbi:MAG TPA: hypothetical protein PKA51_11955 [Kiritimatiellia bacterium]|nr:hypothetical protein [Kiritimatiellia bacterium]
MYQYRIVKQTTRLVRWLVVFPCALLGFLVLMEIIHLFVYFRGYAPWLAYSYVSVLVGALVWAAMKLLVHRRNHRVLTAVGHVVSPQSSHRKLQAALRYHLHYLARLAEHPLLNEVQAAAIRQKTSDLSEVLAHHPLNDDLVRAIDEARTQVIAPAHQYLQGIEETVTHSKVRCVIQDVYQPPFPIVAPLVVVYHQFTLISEMADIYVARPSWGEYLRVIGSVWDVMTKGDFLRYGQRLFSGIDANAGNLGRARQDLGPAMSIIWMTHCVARVAAQRCRTLHDWNLREAISFMNADLPACLAATRDSMVNDALPILKNRFRHQTPMDGRDPDLFAEATSGAFVKSLDAVVSSLRSLAASRPPSGRTQAGDQRMEVPAPPAESASENTVEPVAASTGTSIYAGEMGARRHRRRRRRRHPESPIERLKLFFKRRDRHEP